MKLFKIIKVLQAGEELTDSKNWKDKQTLVSIVGAVLTGAYALLPPDMKGYILESSIPEIAGIIASIGYIVNVYITNATSKKVGLKASPKEGE